MTTGARTETLLTRDIYDLHVCAMAAAAVRVPSQGYVGGSLGGLWYTREQGVCRELALPARRDTGGPTPAL